MANPLRTFISYKWESAEVTGWVERFATDLRQNGVDALLDKWEVSYGDSFVEYMTSKIPSADAFLFVITPGAVASVESQGKAGGAVKFEVEMARAQTIAGEALRFIPVLLKGDGPPKHLRATRYVDFRDPARYSEVFASLLDDLKGKQRKPPLLGQAQLEYEARIYEMLPAVEGSPMRPMMAKFETFAGFPFYSRESDHPPRWPKRVYEDRQKQTRRICAFLYAPEHAAAVAQTLAGNENKITNFTSGTRDSEEEREAQALQLYSNLRMHYNLTLEGDADSLRQKLGAAASEIFLNLERDWWAINNEMPNRLFVVGFRHNHGQTVRRVVLGLEVVGGIYDIMIDNRRTLERDQLESIGITGKFVLDLGDLDPAITSFLRIWYNYLAVGKRWDPKPIHLKAEATQGIILHSLGAEGVDVTQVDSIIKDEGVYRPCKVDLRIPG
jgi:hypothetical protein